MLDDGIGSIRARFDPRSVLFEPLDPAADMGRLAKVPGVQHVRTDGGSWDISLTPTADRAPVIQMLAAAIPPARVELRRPSLEDVFINIVSSEAASGDAATLRAAVREDAGGPREVRA